MTTLPADHAVALGTYARTVRTPCYVYFVDDVLTEARRVRQALGSRFDISFAIKSNPNIHVIRALRAAVDGVDASSGGEIERALQAGWPSDAISFSGPAKRRSELERAVAGGCGQVVCESVAELAALDALAAAAGRRVRVLVRINPVKLPARFGAGMGGRSSQFGIDEEMLGEVLPVHQSWSHLELVGFHVYSGTNSLDEDAIAENFAIMADLFRRAAVTARIHPQQLVFGAGFGIPYHAGQRPLALEALAPRIIATADDLRGSPELRHTRLILEMGRFLIGTSGYFLTQVVNVKESRGKSIALCDGGFNNHLAACGLMGSVIRRNWPMWNITASPSAPRRVHQVAGPLCTTIDTLASDVELPALGIGDILAVGSSGAYGLTASPIHFISHPVPREYMVTRGPSPLTDITEIHGSVAAETWAEALDS